MKRGSSPRSRFWVLGALLLLSGMPLAAGAQNARKPADKPAAAAAATSAPARPKLGLVLSGGGARGLAHVGVLKVLERERIPVDMIAGTSMGAIIGGLYASGMSASDLERELLVLSWERVFASRVERQHLSLRRKEEDFEFSTALEMGVHEGELRVPQGTLSSRGLEILLRRFTLPVRAVDDFGRLPTPFRAIATDMESGQQLVLDKGDLALALRSSMSVPGLFAPIELQGRLLGDGGLVNNLPVDVARAMGAERVIAVNVGTPLAGRETLNSLVGVTAQMINILTEQNVQRAIASLWDEDLLITPELGKLSSADFERTRELIQQGERAAEALVQRLRPLALPPEAYAKWQLARVPAQPRPALPLASVVYEGSSVTHPERFAGQLENQPGKPFDTARAERDARRLASSGDYVRVDYHLQPGEPGDTLVFAMEDKPWGPNYLRIGLDLSTNLSGDSGFDLRISHNRHWLNASGLEWRNQLGLGRTPRLFSELYQPLSWRTGQGDDWFLAGWGELQRRQFSIYDSESGAGLARFSRSSAAAGFDVGQPWGQWGEIRLGLVHQAWRLSPELLATELPPGVLGGAWRETGLRLRTVIDQLDFASFPTRGYRLSLDALLGRQRGPAGPESGARRIELQATGVRSLGAHTLNAHLRILDARQPESSTQGPYTLGGFQQLSGYKDGQLLGNTVGFARLSYYRRLPVAPLLTRGLFLGGSLELGNAWNNRRAVALDDLRHAASLFIGADTGIGPLYLALGHAPRGETALYLFLGRP